MLMGVNKSTMKKLLQKFKNGGNWLGGKVIEYRACFYVFLFTSILFGGLLARQAITHSAEAIELTKDKIILSIENNTLKGSVRDHETALKFSVSMMSQQEEQLKKAENIIRVLIRRIKDLEWPPDVEPNPNKIL